MNNCHHETLKQTWHCKNANLFQLFIYHLMIQHIRENVRRGSRDEEYFKSISLPHTRLRDMA